MLKPKPVLKQFGDLSPADFERYPVWIAGNYGGSSIMSASILVVDDEPDVADLFRQRFRREARQGTFVMHFATWGRRH